MNKYGACETIEEVMAVNREWLSPRQASGVLNCNPYSINIHAKSDPKGLGFPIIKMGTRIKIPKKPFVDFLLKGGTFYD